MFHRVDRRSPKILGPRPKPHPAEEIIIARTGAPWTGDRSNPGTLPREADSLKGPQRWILRSLLVQYVVILVVFVARPSENREL
jgi:hypothetical protein